MFVAVDVPNPIVVTPTTTPASILPGSPRRWVHAIEIYVRSMGTATYIRLGNSFAQHRTLAGMGATSVYEAPQGGVIDAAGVFIVSDTADAEVEVTLLESNIPDSLVRKL